MIVVRNEYSAADGELRIHATGEPAFGGSRRDRREMDHEFGSLAAAPAARLDTTAVQVDEPLGEGESDPESGIGPLVRSVELGEGLEDVIEHFRRNAHAIITNAHHRVLVCGAQRYLDLAAWRRVLHGIVEDVRNDLSEPDAV